jgi:integrase
LDPAQTTIAELLESWLATKATDVTPQSLKGYEITIRLHLIPALGTIRAQKLTPARLQAQYATWIEQGMSARNIRGCHMRLSQALAQAVRFRLVPTNVCDVVTPPKLTTPRPDVWTISEAMAFLDMAATDSLSPLWHLLLLEGMRRGEGLGLRWQDVNWERGTAHIVQTVSPDISSRGEAVIQARTKTKAGARTVKLSGATLAALKERRTRWLERRMAAETWTDNDLIVCSSKGTPINPNNVTRSFELIVRRAGLRRITPHGLRHTHATMLLKQGVPAKIVSERLGHASISITLDTYSHVLPDMQDTAADAMDTIMNGVREQA